MKKALILALGLASLPTLAGVQAVVYTKPAQTCTYNPVSWEVGALAGFAMDDAFRGGSDSIDVYGGDITAVYNFCPHVSMNLRLGYTFGDTATRSTFSRRETDLHSFSLMPGYRYTHRFNDTWSAYIGVNAGVASLSAKDTFDTRGFRFKDHDSAYGFAYSAEVGLRYKLCENSEWFLAYQFYGSTAKPSVGGSDMHKQNYNAVRTGVSFQF